MLWTGETLCPSPIIVEKTLAAVAATGSSLTICGVLNAYFGVASYAPLCLFLGSEAALGTEFALD